jgi:hypothetical protein
MLSPFTETDRLPRAGRMIAPQAGHASSGSTRPRLERARLPLRARLPVLVVIAVVFVKGDDHALSAERELHIQGRAANSGDACVQSLPRFPRSQPSRTLAGREVLENVARVVGVDAQRQATQLRECLPGELDPPLGREIGGCAPGRVGANVAWIRESITI